MTAQRMGCLWLPRFALRLEVLRRPELDGGPIALMASDSTRSGVVLECSPEAEAAGISPGLPLHEALGLCRDLAVVTLDEVRASQEFDRVLDALEAQCGAVEPAGLGVAFVAVPPAVASLERVEDPVLAAILRLVPGQFRARLGVARNKFVAEVAARQARPGEVAAVPVGREAAFLAPLPARWLAPAVGGPVLVRRLELQAIWTLGDLAKLPLGPVQAQFGAEGGLAWKLARGQDPRPLQPRVTQPRAEGRLGFPAPVASQAGLLAGLERLLVRVFNQPAVRGRTVEQMRLRAWMAESGGSWERTFTLREPVASPSAALRHLRGRLANAHPEGAVAELGITLTLANTAAVIQEELWGGRRRQLRGVEEAARQLRARFGHAPGGQLYRIVEVEPWSRIPERRWALVDYGF